MNKLQRQVDALATRENRQAFINVKDYGAVGDGVINDTAAIQDTVTAAGVIGKSVFIPTGTYVVSSPIAIPLAGVELFGEPGTTINCKSRFISITSGGIRNKLIIKDVHFVNLGTAGGGSDDDPCIYTDTSANGIKLAKFINLDIEGFSQGIGVHGGTAYMQAYDMLAVPNFTGNMLGLEGQNTITGCYIHGSLIAAPPGGGAAAPGIYARGGYWQIYGNRIDGMCDGMMAAEDSLIFGNTITNCYYGNGIYASGTKRTSIIGNRFENTRSDGIALNGANSVVIHGNTIYNSKAGAFRLQNSHGISITGNHCYKFDHIIRGYGDPSYDIVFSDNVCTHNDVNTSIVGIPIYFPDACYNVRIENNVFKDFNVTNTAGGADRFIFFTGTGVGRCAVGNTWSNLYPSPADSKGLFKYIDSTVEQYDNTYKFSDGSYHTTNAKVDFSSLSTIVGWSSFTRKVLNYVKINKIIYVYFDIVGTSNSVDTTFTLPYTLPAGTYFINPAIRAQDNGGATQSGFASMTGASDLVTCFKDWAGTTWTASGTKRVVGEFFYVIA